MTTVELTECEQKGKNGEFHGNEVLRCVLLLFELVDSCSKTKQLYDDGWSWTQSTNFQGYDLGFRIPNEIADVALEKRYVAPVVTLLLKYMYS